MACAVVATNKRQPVTRLTQWRLNTLLMRGNASGERNLSSPKGDKRGARILPPPHRGMRGGLFFS